MCSRKLSYVDCPSGLPLIEHLSSSIRSKIGLLFIVITHVCRRYIQRVYNSFLFRVSTLCINQGPKRDLNHRLHCPFYLNLNDAYTLQATTAGLKGYSISCWRLRQQHILKIKVLYQCCFFSKKQAQKCFKIGGVNVV